MIFSKKMFFDYYGDEEVGTISIFRKGIFRIKILGYLKYCSLNQDIVMIGDIKVIEKRKGYGTLLFKKLVEIAGKRGVSSIYGDISPFNEANQSFYKSLGCEIGTDFVVNDYFTKVSPYQFRYVLNNGVN